MLEVKNEKRGNGFGINPVLFQGAHLQKPVVGVKRESGGRGLPPGYKSMECTVIYHHQEFKQGMWPGLLSSLDINTHTSTQE